MSVHAEVSPAEAADRLAIRELFDAYAHCADRRDAEGQKALFNTCDLAIELITPRPTERRVLERVMRFGVGFFGPGAGAEEPSDERDP